MTRFMVEEDVIVVGVCGVDGCHGNRRGEVEIAWPKANRPVM